MIADPHFVVDRRQPRRVRGCLRCEQPGMVRQVTGLCRRCDCVGGHGKLPSDGHVTARWR